MSPPVERRQLSRQQLSSGSRLAEHRQNVWYGVCPPLERRVIVAECSSRRVCWKMRVCNGRSASGTLATPEGYSYTGRTWTHSWCTSAIVRCM